MKITHYYLDVGHSTMPKNNLEKEYAEFLRSFNGVLIKADNLETLRNIVLKKQSDLNKKHSRCKPLYFGFHSSVIEGNTFLSGFCQSFDVRAATIYSNDKLLKQYYDSN